MKKNREHSNTNILEVEEMVFKVEKYGNLLEAINTEPDDVYRRLEEAFISQQTSSKDMMIIKRKIIDR